MPCLGANTSHFIHQFPWIPALPIVFGLGLLSCNKDRLGSYDKAQDHTATRPGPLLYLKLHDLKPCSSKEACEAGAGRPTRAGQQEAGSPHPRSGRVGGLLFKRF